MMLNKLKKLNKPRRLSKPKNLSAGVVLFLISLTLFTVVVSAAATEIPPPVSGIEIFEYRDSIVQQAGTNGTYEVKIKNIGVLSLQDIKLGAEKIQEGWFSSDDAVDLEFGEIGVLKYELKVPESASDLDWFSLVVSGSYGAGTTSDIKPVVLNIVALPEASITTTTTPETTKPVITLPPIIPILENLTETIDELKEKLKAKELWTCPEIVFSKFRAVVTYARVTARTVLANEVLMYKTAAILFVVMLILAAGKKLIMG